MIQSDVYHADPKWVAVIQLEHVKQVKTLQTIAKQIWENLKKSEAPCSA